jgi:hypothetical protein
VDIDQRFKDFIGEVSFVLGATTHGTLDCFVTEDLFSYLASVFHGLSLNATHGEARNGKQMNTIVRH